MRDALAVIGLRAVVIETWSGALNQPGTNPFGELRLLEIAGSKFEHDGDLFSLFGGELEAVDP